MTIYGGTATFGSLFFADGTTGDEKYRGAVQYNHTDDTMRFYASGSSRLWLSSSVLYPNANNVLYLGAASYRWIQYFGVNADDISSDINMKMDIEESVGLDFINKLNPISWVWKDKSIDTKRHHGLIAQEVKQVVDETGIGFEEIGENAKSLVYTGFIAPLIKSVQEMSSTINQLKKQIEEMQNDRL
jgi:hypothetical protein